MKHLAIHLAIALTMFMVGTTANTLFSTHSDSRTKPGEVVKKSRADEESEITAAVFRHQMGEGSSSALNTYAPLGTGLPNIYYLSCYNYSDPSDKILTQLAPTPSLRVKKLSELQPDQFAYMGANKIFLRAGSIRWISATEVVVGGSCRSGWSLTGQSYVYHLVRENGVWRVMSSETIS